MAIALDCLSAEAIAQLRPPVLWPLDPLITLEPRPRRPAFDPDAFAYLRDRTFHQLRDEMGVRYRPGSAPPCRRLELLIDGFSGQVELGGRIYDGLQLRLPLLGMRGVIDHQALDYVGFVRICELFWDGQAEAFNRDYCMAFDWRSDVELRNRINDASRGLPPRPAAYDYPIPHGRDMAADETYTIVERRSLLTGDIERRAMTATQEHAAVTYQRQLEAAVLADMERRVFDYARNIDPRNFPTFQWFGSDLSEAEARGLQLLKEWLSPAQLAQYEAHRHFDVTGGSSGKRYRIKRGRVQNVYELDPEGFEICGWCFAPAGNLVAGDVMLAQKVALETNERGALKVANPFADFSSIGPGRIYGRSPAFNASVEMATPTVRTRPRQTDPEPAIDSRSWLANWGGMARRLMPGPPRNSSSRASRRQHR